MRRHRRSGPWSAAQFSPAVPISDNFGHDELKIAFEENSNFDVSSTF
jgi:hypothetical protein